MDRRRAVLIAAMLGALGCSPGEGEGPKRVPRPPGESSSSSSENGKMPVTGPERKIATH